MSRPTHIALKQWLSAFFVLVHTFKFAQKPVHPCHALKSSSVNMQNFSDFYDKKTSRCQCLGQFFDITYQHS